MVVKVYYSSVSSSLEIKKAQQKIFMVLEGKKIAFERVDISADDEAKKFMLEKTTEHALPPQIFNDDQYCGDFESFDESVEMETLDSFLKL
ncbi:SH3 domain-binding glutamic acid-rich protein homolog [Glandiceps talaboti]